ncbi:MAG: orotate phosphoribosyltransferase [Bacteroidales bacterium]|nr:orotate phosphoribosyltransferase [Bacteroidales bacterium]
MENNNLSRNIAQNLLQIKAIKFNTTNPFIWASGIKSPIYCDNRKTLSFPKVRNIIKKAFVEIIKENFPDTEIIAGVATGAIAQGALVADELNLSFIYVRPDAKSHGLKNMIEGTIEKGKKVVVVEDLISTGGSSLKAVDAIRKEECEILGMVAIFTYGFNVAKENFKKSNCKLITLSNYDDLIKLAEETGYIEKKELSTLIEWKKNPEKWKK